MTRIDNPGDTMDHARATNTPRAQNEAGWRRAMEKAEIDGWFDDRDVHFRPQLVRMGTQAPRAPTEKTQASTDSLPRVATANAIENTGTSASLRPSSAEGTVARWSASPASVLAWRAAASANDAEGPSTVAGQAHGGVIATPRSTAVTGTATPALAPMALRDLGATLARFDSESGAAPLSTRLVHAGVSADGVVLWVRDASIDAPARDNVVQRLRDWARAHGVRISGIFFNGRRIYRADGLGMLNDNA